jgi:Cytidylate kinase
MEKIIIAISREFGSGGRLVGEILAEKLGIKQFDRNLIELAAEKSGLSKEFIESSEDQATSSFLYSLAASAQTHSGYFMSYDTPINDKAFYAQSSIIKELAAKDSCIILGRCAGYILRDNKYLINIMIRGSKEDRARRCRDEYDITEKKLDDFIAKRDKGRANYYKYYTGETWYDTRAYNMVLDTSYMGVQGAADAIIAAIEARGKM